MLKAQAEKAAIEAEKAREAEAAEDARIAAEKAAAKPRGGSRRQSAGEAFLKSTVRTIGTTLGRELSRGLLGSLFRRR